MTTSTIVIRRAKSFQGSATKHQIEIDGTKIGQVSNGETVKFDVPSGEHSVIARLSVLGTRAASNSLQINLEPGETTAIDLRIVPNGLELSSEGEYRKQQAQRLEQFTEDPRSAQMALARLEADKVAIEQEIQHTSQGMSTGQYLVLQD
jgi:hypothetical protein